MSLKGGRHFDTSQLKITRGALYLLFAEIGLSLVFHLSSAASRIRIMDFATATPTQVWREGKVWTLVTSPILQVEFVSLLFNGLLLWMLVPTIERWWGTRRLLMFALWTSLAGSIAGTLVGLATGHEVPIAGLDPFLYGIIIAFGVLYARHPVQFFGVLPMTGRQLMFGIIGFVTLFVLIGAEWEQGAGFAGAMLVAWLLSTGRWNPRLWLLKWRQRRARSHLSVVDGGKGGGRSGPKWVN